MSNQGLENGGLDLDTELQEMISEILAEEIVTEIDVNVLDDLLTRK
jgi:hypothetical protein